MLSSVAAGGSAGGTVAAPAGSQHRHQLLVQHIKRICDALTAKSSTDAAFSHHSQSLLAAVARVAPSRLQHLAGHGSAVNDKDKLTQAAATSFIAEVETMTIATLDQLLRENGIMDDEAAAVIDDAVDGDDSADDDSVELLDDDEADFTVTSSLGNEDNDDECETVVSDSLLGGLAGNSSNVDAPAGEQLAEDNAKRQLKVFRARSSV